jgi:hypothetical protein
VRCDAVTQIEHIVLRNEDATKDADGNGCLILLNKPQQEACPVEHPMPLFGLPTKHTPRINQGMSLFMFPINIGHAVTVQKLQGKTIKDPLVSGCHHPDNWMRVVLSQVKTLSGVRLRHPVNGNKICGMAPLLRKFLKHFQIARSKQRQTQQTTHTTI